MRPWMLVALTGCAAGDFSFNQDDNPIVTPEGSAALELSATELHYTEVAPRVAQSQILVITSTGEIALEIHEGIIIGADRTDFYTDESAHEDVVLEPGETHEAVIVVDAAEARTLEAAFHLDTNANPLPTIDVPLTGEPTVSE
jgi:hypothetical protein